MKKGLGYLASVGGLLLPAIALAEEVNAANTAWILTSTALV